MHFLAHHVHPLKKAAAALFRVGPYEYCDLREFHFVEHGTKRHSFEYWQLNKGVIFKLNPIIYYNCIEITIGECEHFLHDFSWIFFPFDTILVKWSEEAQRDASL